MMWKVGARDLEDKPVPRRNCQVGDAASAVQLQGIRDQLPPSLESGIIGRRLDTERPLAGWYPRKRSHRAFESLRRGLRYEVIHAPDQSLMTASAERHLKPSPRRSVSPAAPGLAAVPFHRSRPGNSVEKSARATVSPTEVLSMRGRPARNLDRRAGGGDLREHLPRSTERNNERSSTSTPKLGDIE